MDNFTIQQRAPTSFPGSLSYHSRALVGENPGNEVELAPLSSDFFFAFDFNLATQDTGASMQKC